MDINMYLKNIKKRIDSPYPHSFYEIKLDSGEELSETEYAWRDVSTESHPAYKDGFKTVYTLNFPAVSAKMIHRNLMVEMEVPKDCLVYQSMISRIVATKDMSNTVIIGRTLGLIKDGRIIKEYRLEDNLSEPIIYIYE